MPFPKDLRGACGSGRCGWPTGPRRRATGTWISSGHCRSSAVVLGHWLISAPYFVDGAPAYSHLSGPRAVVAVVDLALPGDAGVLLCRRVFKRGVVGVGAPQGSGLPGVVRRPRQAPHRTGSSAPSRVGSDGRGRPFQRSQRRDDPNRLQGGAGAGLVPRRLHHGRGAGATDPRRVEEMGIRVGRGAGRGGGSCRCRLLRLGLAGARLEQLPLCLAHRPPTGLRLARPPPGRSPDRHFPVRCGVGEPAPV